MNRKSLPESSQSSSGGHLDFGMGDSVLFWNTSADGYFEFPAFHEKSKTAPANNNPSVDYCQNLSKMEEKLISRKIFRIN